MSSPQQTTTDFHDSDVTAKAGPKKSDPRGFHSATAYADELTAIGAAATQSSTQKTALTVATIERPPVVRLTLSHVDTSLPLAARAAEVLRLQVEAFAQTDNWVVMYRELLGVDGVVRKLYKTADEIRVWESSREFDEVHAMLAVMRSQDNGKGDTIEIQRMITVRLPTSMHETLKKESDESGLSINKLCITKLLQKMDARFVPLEPGKRRGRKPGPQGKRVKKADE